MKKGLILEGGAMRGMFTAGVLDVMMENGIVFDGAVGVSAGACFGCNYKSGQPGRAIRYNKRFARDRRYCSFYSLLTTGDLYGAEFCYHELPTKLDIFDEKAFIENPMEFYVVCTDAETGKAVYRRIDDCSDESLDWIRASASMPIVSRPVELSGRKLLDGGISDSIPLRWFRSQGYDKNVVVLTQPASYRKKPISFQKEIRFLLRKYPAVYERLLTRHEEYNSVIKEISALEKQGKVFVIRPEEALGIGKIEHDPGKMEKVYQIGRKEAKSKLERLKNFLK